MAAEFEAVIGLEVHAQLATETKIFCACPAKPPSGKSVADLEPNALSCPTCAGHPGTLPRLNAQAVAFAVKAGLAVGCSIRRRSVFARKNYFYPDLPKGYQISQYDQPICENGLLALPSTGKAVRIQRIHLEEDAGKSVHAGGETLVNLNRAGVPLIEIVSHPDLATPAEAGEYLRELHAVVTSLGVCDGNMQEGNFRCDANVSVRPRGAVKLGTRVEIKNVNSFRFVEKAIDYEIRRQTGLIGAGGAVVQETRLFDSERGVTESMRSKEEAEDYRYFPDPDLPPVRVSETEILKIQSSLPELPAQKRARYRSGLGLSDYDAGVLTSESEISRFFEATLESLPAAAGAAVKQDWAKLVANWVSGEVLRYINEKSLRNIRDTRLTPRHLADLVVAVKDGVVSGSGAKQILAEIWNTGEAVAVLVDRLGLKQESDAGALEPIVDRVIQANQEQFNALRGGKDKLMGFFVGLVMKESKGKANPALVQELLRKRL